MSVPPEPGPDAGTAAPDPVIEPATEPAEPEQFAVLMRQLDDEAESAPPTVTLPSWSRFAAAVTLVAGGLLAAFGSLLPFGQVSLAASGGDPAFQIRYTGWGTQLLVGGSQVSAETGPFWGVTVLVVALLVILTGIALAWPRVGLRTGRPLATTAAGLLIGVIVMLVVEVLGDLRASAVADPTSPGTTSVLAGVWLVGLAAVVAIGAIVLILVVKDENSTTEPAASAEVGPA
ncbi:MAG TPA: hypothetical protein VHW44_24075 [Pseudonocardiaceae bacterium]|jgi:hypothetical protein|nr:hypothetical protein [Pseudonocardiaceae bacterium]